jgi:hypothetical protein
MQPRTQIIPVQITDSTILYVQATLLGGEQDIAARFPSFDGITDVIEKLAGTIVKTLEKVKPDKASVEFGLEIAVESGKITAFLVKGTGTANLKITLEWDKGSSPQQCD